MSSNDLAGFGVDWLPPTVQRRIAVEDRQEARAARQDARDREARLADRHDRALAAARDRAMLRGEEVPPQAMVTGEGLARTVAETLADAAAQGAIEDARTASRERHERGEERVWIEAEPVGARRAASDWPGSEYELGRLIDQADELHRWRIAFEARHGYRSVESTEAERSANRARGQDVTRACSADGMSQLGSLTGKVIR